MSFYEDASLIVLADGAYDGGIKAFKPVLNDSDPSDPNYLVPSGVGDFTVARNSVATRVNADGLIEEVAANIPRLDYSNGSCPVWLCEPTTTNLITHSEDFSNAAWGKVNVTISANAVLSPDGSVNADKLIEDATTANHYIRFNSFNLTSGTTYTFSCFVKASERTKININNFNGTSDITSIIDLSSGVIEVNGNGTAEIKDYGGGWFRISQTYTATTTTTTNFANQIILNNGSNSSYLGDGTSGVYIFGAQVEQQSYATSYVPTSGAAATRLADEITGAGDSSTFNSSEGVLNSVFKALVNDSTFRTITISDGTSNNRIGIGYNSVSNTIEAFYDLAGVSQCSLSYTVSDITEESNVSFRYSLNNFSLWVDNVKVDEDLSGSVGGTWDRLNLDRGAGGGSFYGRVKRILTFNDSSVDVSTL